jgi:hypothetical protein
MIERRAGVIFEKLMHGESSVRSGTPLAYTVPQYREGYFKANKKGNLKT